MARDNVGTKVIVDMRGLDGLVGEALARTITLKTVRAGIRQLVGPARSAAPKRSGALKQAQGFKAAKGRRGKTLAFAVQGARTAVSKRVEGRKRPAKPSLYDHLVQGGVQPHATRKGSRLARVVETKSSVNFKPGAGQGGRRHPRARANPYRRRAATASEPAMSRAMQNEAAAELQKAVDRQAAKLSPAVRG